MNTPLPTFPGTVSTDSVKISWAEYASLRTRADAVPMLVDALKAFAYIDRSTYSGMWAIRPELCEAARTAIAQATPLLADSEKPFGLPGAVPSNTDVRATVGEPTAWLIPVLMTFEGVTKTSCPEEMRSGIEGTVAWDLSFIGDTGPVTDKFGAEHNPRPLFEKLA